MLWSYKNTICAQSPSFSCFSSQWKLGLILKEVCGSSDHLLKTSNILVEKKLLKAGSQVLWACELRSFTSYSLILAQSWNAHSGHSHCKLINRECSGTIYRWRLWKPHLLQDQDWLSVAATSDNQLMQIQIQLLLRIIHISVTHSMKSLFRSQMSMSAWEQRLKIEDQTDVEVVIRHLWETEAGVRSLLVAKCLNTQHYPLPFVLCYSLLPHLIPPFKLEWEE